jgi:hypothetical protein
VSENVMALINQYMGFDEMYNHHNIAVSLKMLYILKMALFFGGKHYSKP